jgi:hypothetical protein
MATGSAIARGAFAATTNAKFSRTNMASCAISPEIKIMTRSRRILRNSS